MTALVFENAQGKPENFDGVTVGVAVLALDDFATDLIPSMHYLSEVTTLWEVSGGTYARDTIGLSYSLESGDGVLRYTSGVPTFDLAGIDPVNAVVFYNTAGADDDAHELLIALSVTEGAGFDGWTANEPTDGLWRIGKPVHNDLTGRDAADTHPIASIIGLEDALAAGGGVPAGGTTGQALTKVSSTDGDVEWSTVSGGGADHAALFIRDQNFADANVAPYDGGSVPRSAIVGYPVLIVSGTNLGLWTVTATGSFTAGSALAVSDVIVDPSPRGLMAVATTSTGGAVDGVSVQATSAVVDAAAEAMLVGIDGEAALRTILDGPVTVRQFRLCADNGDDHDDRSWWTPKPGSFTGGVWIEALLTVTGLELLTSPSDGDLVYQEIATQTADGIGIWDGFELAVESTWRAAAGQWEHKLFWEHTATGGTAETYQISTSASSWHFTEGQPTRVAVWIDFNTAGQSTGMLLREAPDGAFGGIPAAGRFWRIISRQYGAPTDIDPGITEDWYIGAGNGHVLCDEVIIRNGGPAGTVLASPNAADAWAAADAAFDDPQSNTWTPGPAACTVAGTTPGGGTGNIAADTHAATSKTTPVDADELALVDSAASNGLKKLTWANLKTALASIFVPQTRTINGVDLSANRILPNNNWLPNPIIAWAGWTAANNGATRGAQASGRWFTGYVDTPNTAGSYAEWQFMADAGTWTVLPYGDTLATAGTTTLKIDGATVGTWNQYSVGTVVAVAPTPITGITISTNGVHTLRAENTAAGAGGGYVQRYCGFQFIRTA